MQSIITYDPNAILSVLGDWDHLVGDFFGRDFNLPGNSGSPAVDIFEEKERYMLHAELPGFSEKDVDIKVNDRILTISSNKDEKKVDIEGSWLIKERGVRTFKRSFSMPRDVDLEAIQASFKDGLLSVVLPKRPEAREKSIDIKRS